MNKITEIFKSNKYVIIWTVFYVALVWAILLFMFNFNIFVGHQWMLLMNAEIRGFAGFVFGILMLAAIPMYIATTAIIVRTNKPLITVNITPVIKIFNAIIPHPVIAESAPQITNELAPAPEQQPTTPQPQPDNDIPRTMPTELRGAFIRARQHIDGYAPSVLNTTPDITTPTPDIDTTPQMGELPLPTDFDFDATPDTDSDFIGDAPMPTFTDINFGDDTTDNDDDNVSAPITTTDNNDIINYIGKMGITPRTHDDMIIANDIIIAPHCDPDYWIADPENWFAAGKQKPSPIIRLIKASATLGLRPVLYLASTNIMELDECRAEWTKMGVTVITDLSQLPL